MTGPAWEALLGAADALRIEAAARDPWLHRLRLAGIGWATVELERAAEDLATGFRRGGAPEPTWRIGVRDELLGAGAWTSAIAWALPGGDAWPELVLLEPDTEGRLAAALARFDEGVAAVYLAPRRGAPIEPADASRLGAVAAGPLGPQRIVLARPGWGPHVLVLARPAGDGT